MLAGALLSMQLQSEKRTYLKVKADNGNDSILKPHEPVELLSRNFACQDSPFLAVGFSALI